MLELTSEECLELERRAKARIAHAFADTANTEIAQGIAQISVISVIHTIREYERMQAEKKAPPLSAE